MRNISKTATLEHKFPLLVIEDACVLSKEADVSIGFEIALPELFTLSSNDYDHLHSM
ncbi:DUF3875 domain-containing protein [Riemerella anatipestifer]|nr:DUF3875 domain-containing protein [Riemerella anatipestifer]